MSQVSILQANCLLQYLSTKVLSYVDLRPCIFRLCDPLTSRPPAFQLLEAVAALHENGIVHRDIKGANIFLTDEMQNLKLGDFGCAVKIKAHTTMPGELQGFVGTQGTSGGGSSKSWEEVPPMH